MPNISEFTRAGDEPVFICGCKESVLAASAQAGWPDVNLPWTIVDELPRLSFDELKAAMTRAMARWAKICGLKPYFTDTARDARLLIGSRAIDGPGRILAECELPFAGARQVRMWLDIGEDWGIDLSANDRSIRIELVGWHEIGHGTGMGHAPEGSPNVMAPIYNARQLEAGPWDVREMTARYGKPVILTPPPTIPPSIPSVPSTPASGGIMGNILALAKLIAQLQPIITWLVANQAQFGTVLEVLKKIAAAFAVPQANTMAMAMGLERDSIKEMVVGAAALFTRYAAQTPAQWDDLVAALFAEAVANDWLLDFFLKLISGDAVVTHEMLAQALSEVKATA